MTRDEIVRESGGGMFAVIPAVVMRDTALPMSARMLYGLLTWKSNGEARCWPTNRTLAEELGLSQGRVSALLALLEEYGHIEMEVIHDAQTGQVVRRYIYPLMKRMGGIPENEDTSPRDSADPPPENSEVYKEKQKEETKTPPKAPPRGAGRVQASKGQIRPGVEAGAVRGLLGPVPPAGGPGGGSAGVGPAQAGRRPPGGDGPGPAGSNGRGAVEAWNRHSLRLPVAEEPPVGGRAA